MHGLFPTPFTDEFLEGVVAQKMYSFIDGFFGYHQIRITKEDRQKTTFVIEWGYFQCNVMPFGLKNAPAIFFVGCRCIQRFFLEVLAILYGLLYHLWIDHRPSRKPTTNAGKISTASDHTEIKEVYFLCTFWDAVGSHRLQARTVG